MYSEEYELLVLTTNNVVFVIPFCASDSVILESFSEPEKKNHIMNYLSDFIHVRGNIALR